MSPSPSCAPPLTLLRVRWAREHFTQAEQLVRWGDLQAARFWADIGCRDLRLALGGELRAPASSRSP